MHDPQRQDGAPWWNEGAFLYIGRMGANKGVPEILTAWLGLARRLGTRCPDLWLAGGSPPEIEAVRAQCRNRTFLERMEQRGRLRWWGYLDEDGLSTLLLKARVLIMHSAYEPGGRVVLEAMTQGVAAIATPHGFACDLVRDWVNGFLVPFEDVALLRRRMEHFANQPLLGASMGIAARATARAALSDWDFYRTHGQVYAAAAIGAGPPPLRSSARALDVIHDPLPRGLSGRYPFAVTAPDEDDARLAATELIGEPSNLPQAIGLPPENCSLRWRIAVGDDHWILSHLYSIYVERAIWDKDHCGPLFCSGAERRSREAEASRLPGFVRLLEHSATGLHIRKDLPEADPEVKGAERLRAALSPFRALWTHPPSVDDGRALAGRANDWWRLRAECPWRSDGDAAALLRMATLRVAWPETADKFRRGKIEIGNELGAAVGAIAPAAEALVEREAELMPLCTQHGDCRLSMVRREGGERCLIGGDCAHLGWWGRDLALLLLSYQEADRCGVAFDLAVTEFCTSSEQRALVLLWGVIEAVFRLAEAHMRDVDVPESEARLVFALSRFTASR